VHIYIYYQQGKELIHMDIFRKLKKTTALLCAGTVLFGAGYGYNLNGQLMLHAAEATNEGATPRISIDQGVKISKIFPDYALGNDIARILDKANENAIVTQAELDTITEFTAHAYGIKSMEGFQYLTNLERLTFHMQIGVKDLAPITKLQKLTYADFGYTYISDISAIAGADWPEMRELRLSDAWDIFDFSPFKTAYMPKIENIEVSGHLSEYAIPSVKTNETIIIDNPVIGFDGELEAPVDGYAPDGEFSYEDGKLIWHFDKAPSTLTRINAYWSNELPIGNGTLRYYTSYSVDVVDGAYPVNYIAPQGYIEQGIVKPGELIEMPDNRQVEQYDNEFIGWYTAATGGKKWNFARDKMPAKTLNLYARYRPKKFKVTFDNEGEQHFTAATVNRRITQPTKPQKPGYIFKGWSTSTEYENLWDFSRWIVWEDLTLYAVFEPALTVTYDIDGVLETADAQFEKKLKRPTNPEKEGYRFRGWFTERVGGRQWNFSRDLMPDEDMTLYARFTKLKEPKAPLNKPINTEMQEQEEVTNEDAHLTIENNEPLADTTVEETEDVL
jgi:uncharacterized repeat protein (TIGR02543 family)